MALVMVGIVFPVAFAACDALYFMGLTPPFQLLTFVSIERVTRKGGRLEPPAAMLSHVIGPRARHGGQDRAAANASITIFLQFILEKCDGVNMQLKYLFNYESDLDRLYPVYRYYPAELAAPEFLPFLII